MHERRSFRRSVVRNAVIAAGLALSLTVSGAYAQSAEDKASARALATQAQDALKNNKFSDALDLASRAEALYHAPVHVLMVARAQVGLGRLVAAKESYLTLTREDLPASAPAAFKKAQEDGKSELATIEPRIAAVKVVLDNVKDKKVTVKIDDQPVNAALIGVYKPIDPGKHEVAAYATGLSPVKSTVELKDGEKKDVKLTIPDAAGPPGPPLKPEDNPDAIKPPVDQNPNANNPPPVDTTTPAPEGKRSGVKTALGITGIGLGVVGGALGAIFMIKRSGAQKNGDDLYNQFNQCKKGCTAVQTDAISSYDTQAANDGTIAAIGFIGGGVALVAGVIILATNKKQPPPQPAASSLTISPWFSGTSGGFTGRF